MAPVPPRLEVTARDQEGTVLGYLGPDLLGADWDADEALRRLLAAPNRPVFLALLDQRNLAGLGNEYVNELCFLRGVLPTRPTGEVPQPKKLVALAQRLIAANKDRTGRTTTGRLRGDTSWVYGRAGKPCLRCGRLIQHATLGGPGEHARESYWCAPCQA